MGGELLLDVGAPATDLTLAKAVHNKEYMLIPLVMTEHVTPQPQLHGTGPATDVTITA